MKAFILSICLVLGLSISAYASSEEDMEVYPYIKSSIIPISIVERDIVYPNALEEEDSIITIFVTTFKGSPSKVEIDIESESGILY